jgi:hypothetical protein
MSDHKDQAPHTSAAAPSTSSNPLAGRSARAREHIVGQIEAKLPEAFARELRGARVQTIGLFVSQYWNDEAEDAVHIDYRYSFDVVSDPALLRACSDDDEDEDEEGGGAFDQAKTDFEDALLRALPYFDANGELITAFASYACESDQETREYVPYCLWHLHDGGRVARSDVGTMRRPAWEDAEHDSERASAPRPSARMGVWVVLAVVVAVAFIAAWRLAP